MKANNANIEFIYNNLKNGDFLAFYAKKWWHYFARLIACITGIPISHIAGVFDVERQDNVLSFSIGEQLVKEGRVTNRYSIVKTKGTFLVDSRFKDNAQDLYYLSNAFRLCTNENKKLKVFWSKKDDYNFSELLLTPNWIFRLYSWFLAKVNRKPKDKYDGICSSAAAQSMSIIGFHDAKFTDKVPNPKEFIGMSYIKSIHKISA
jgi:hypothetical protein